MSHLTAASGVPACLHAPEDTPLAELPIIPPAQQNCVADRLADEYLSLYPRAGRCHSYHMVPLLPTTGCQLHLPQGTVTYNFKHTLACRAPPICTTNCATGITGARRTLNPLTGYHTDEPFTLFSSTSPPLANI
jgi:hypothetical protein